MRASGAGAGIIGAVIAGMAKGMVSAQGDRPEDVHGDLDTRVDVADRH